jgi:hypothetical protein
MKKDDDKEVFLSKVDLSITQPNDGNGEGGDQWLNITITDCGGGPYFVIETGRWAFNSIEELAETLSKHTSKFFELAEEITESCPSDDVVS